MLLCELVEVRPGHRSLEQVDQVDLVYSAISLLHRLTEEEERVLVPLTIEQPLTRRVESGAIWLNEMKLLFTSSIALGVRLLILANFILL